MCQLSEAVPDTQHIISDSVNPGCVSGATEALSQQIEGDGAVCWTPGLTAA